MVPIQNCKTENLPSYFIVLFRFLYTEIMLLSLGTTLLLTMSCGVSVVAPNCEDDVETSCFKGVFRTLLGQPVEGIQLCVHGNDSIPCTQTDSSGQWKLPGLPLDEDIGITAEHEDYVSSLFGQHTSMAWYDWYKVAVPKSIMSTNANRLDVDLDSSKGHILFLTWEGLNIDGIDTSNVEGVQLANADSFENAFYGDVLGLASDNLTETSVSGSGGVLNLSEGIHSLRFTGAGGECGLTHMFHYQPNEDGIPVPVIPGFTTAIDIICPLSN